MVSKDLPDEMMRELIELDRLARLGIPYVPPSESVAGFVRMQRGLVGRKQNALASFAEVSLSTVQRIERGDPVSAKSLDQVAMALVQEPGAFTKPRVPLTLEEQERKLEEWLDPFEDLTPVSVRPLRTQPQIAELARCKFRLIDDARLGDAYQDDIAALNETLDFLSFAFEVEKKESIHHFTPRWKPIKRRHIYTMVLDQVRGIERRGYAVALAGTYQAETGAMVLPTADVALIAFFPKLSDPAANKRRVLLAPAKVDVAATWQRFCRSVDEQEANNSSAG